VRAAVEDQTAVLLDEHPLWLEAVENVLHRVGIRVVGKATSAKEALMLVEESNPDLFLAELPEPSGAIGGTALVRRARELVAGLRVIVLSADTTAERIDGALEAGAAAYVVKTAHSEDLASAVRQAFSHSVYLAGHHNATPARVEVGRDAADEPGLTRRELEILRLVADGHSNAQLARMLWVTEQTVKFHLSNIYRKLDVANRTEASRWAQLHGLLDGRSADGAAAAALQATA
jgi:DNA-binding NarL/FixJ family response regulator